MQTSRPTPDEKPFRIYTTGSLGAVTLDVVIANGDDHLAMYIDGVQRTDRVTGQRLLNEAAHSGLGRVRAAEIVRDLLDRTPEATCGARQASPDVPDHLLSIIDQQLERLRSDI
jgi:hypothetical protein